MSFRPSDAPTRGPLVLIVDDDEEFRVLLARFLEPLYRVAFAGDGDEALRTLEEEIPSLVLLDINMPKKNGVEFLRAIRENEATRHLPVIVLFATGSPDDLRAIRPLSPAYILPKEDVSLARVRELVKTHLLGGERTG